MLPLVVELGVLELSCLHHIQNRWQDNRLEATPLRGELEECPLTAVLSACTSAEEPTEECLLLSVSSASEYKAEGSIFAFLIKRKYFENPLF